jgi:hypothetical protein
MYLECKICKRVTEHKRIDKQSSTHVFSAGMVSSNVFYICPHCNTGVAGTEITTSIGSNIQSTFETRLGY